jgi:hypothetical protein
MKLPEPGSGGGTVALCERCGEEIAVANDLDLAGDAPRAGIARAQMEFDFRTAIATGIIHQIISSPDCDSAFVHQELDKCGIGVR